MGEPHIEVEIGSDHHDPKTARLKSWSNIIATAGALVIAVLAFFKPQDETPTRATYAELKRAAEENSKQIAQNHDDIVALRGYLDGYLHDSVILPSSALTAAPSAAPPASASASAKAKPAPPPPQVYVIPTATGDAAPPLPSLHPRPKPQQLPDYDKVMKQ